MNKGKILVVDDNAGVRAALKILLPRHFAGAEFLASPKTLPARMREFMPDAVLLDMNFDTDINTGNEGLFWLSEIKRINKSVEVVLFTAYADIQLAVEGMKRGAFDFVVKPYDNDKLVETLSSACNKSRKVTVNTSNSKTESSMYWGDGLEMRRVRDIIQRIAPTDANVLITGENGTGKDVMACEIHRLSERCKKPMVSVDLGAVTPDLFESELFGHVKGAFTGAVSDHVGKIQAADGGTLFLDEIGNIPLEAQAKLLRVLQNRTIVRVGDTCEMPVDIRLICATNKDIRRMVIEGSFREDLYYRINTIHINLPPLRERKEEIIPLSKIFIKRYAEKYHRTVADISKSGEKALLAHEWNGNIRELQNCIEKAVILSSGTELTEKDLDLSPSVTYETSKEISAEESLEDLERKAICAAMEHYNGNLTAVARSLGISRPTLYAKLKKYDI